MMTRKSKAAGMPSPVRQTAGGGVLEAAGWEVRPGGMLVQRRNSDQNQAAIPKIRVRVKHGSSDHEISISPQASFGELKKMLAGASGLHPQDQKIIHTSKERDSKVCLNVAEVSDGSKMVLIEDVGSRERRVVEWRRAEKMDKASMAIAEIGLEVDKLANKVLALESGICSGKKADETVLLSLIELLMTQLLKLDEVVAEGDVKLQRREQVRRVQKYIETLDLLKIRNASIEVKPLFQQQQEQMRYSTGLMPKAPQTKQGRRNLATAATLPAPFTSSADGDPLRFPYNYPPAHFPIGKLAELK